MWALNRTIWAQNRTSWTLNRDICVFSCQINRFHVLFVSVSNNKNLEGVHSMVRLQGYFLLFVVAKTKKARPDLFATPIRNKRSPPSLTESKVSRPTNAVFFNNLKQDSGNYEGSNQGWVKDCTHWFVIEEVQCESWKCFRNNLQSMKSRFVCSIWKSF